jgi:hypothetical protein
MTARTFGFFPSHQQSASWLNRNTLLQKLNSRQMILLIHLAYSTRIIFLTVVELPIWILQKYKPDDTFSPVLFLPSQ